MLRTCLQTMRSAYVSQIRRDERVMPPLLPPMSRSLDCRMVQFGTCRKSFTGERLNDGFLHLACNRVNLRSLSSVTLVQYLWRHTLILTVYTSDKLINPPDIAIRIPTMHHVLGIAEILRCIFSLLDQDDNARNARVCKHWTDIALDFAWKHAHPGVFRSLAPTRFDDARIIVRPHISQGSWSGKER